jgi:hypothetical protein
VRAKATSSTTLFTRGVIFSAQVDWTRGTEYLRVHQ